MGALTATAQPKYHQGVEPMLPGFNYAPFGDLDAILTASVSDLEVVEGVGEARAIEIREGLRRIGEVDLVDRYT